MQRHKDDRALGELYVNTSVLIVGRLFRKEVAGNESGQIGMAHCVCFAKELGLYLIGQW